MNSLIELLNQWGGLFLNFSWPMLWQSSLLIVLVLAVDFLLRNKLRASLRYALWLVVLLKLCLPPSLALPTSPAWWLHKTQTAVAQPPLKKYTVTYNDTPAVGTPTTPLPAFVPPRPTMTIAACLLLFSSATSVALFAWLTIRWRQIARKIQTGGISERLTAIATEAQNVAGIKCAIPVRLAINSMSPAVCGLFRPTILIPQSMAGTFSDEQLRAVLLHELIHVRRFDVWVNFWQALLQIIYWWHPLVWLANARIRRAREEAVDDAVMLALRDDADSYAPTLLEVAKLSLDRATLSLGLVGILESRNSLRQRIERLLDFHPPRHAGLTLASLLGILAFTVVAVPMGEAPANDDGASKPASATAPASDEPTNSTAFVIESHFYWLCSADFQTVTAKNFEWWKIREASGDSCWVAAREQFNQLREKLNLSGLKPFCSPRVLTRNGLPAELSFGNDSNLVDLECIPSTKGSVIDLVIRGKILTTISEAATTNQFHFKIAMAGQQGLVIHPELSGNSGGSNLVMTISMQTITNNPRSWFFEKTPPSAPAPSNPPAARGVLADPNFQAAIHKLKQRTGSETMPEPEVTTTSIRGQNRVNRAPASATFDILGDAPASEESKEAFDHPASTNKSDEKLFSRVFKVDPNSLHYNFGIGSSSESNSVADIIKRLAGRAGVNFDSPAGRVIVYNERSGLLFVKAPQSDLDALEHVILKVDTTPRQVHIKARFIEVPMEIAKTFEQSLKMTNGSERNLYGILRGQEFKAIIRSMNSTPGCETLAEPEITTLSGRQTQMRATSVTNILIAYNVQSKETGGSLMPQTEEVETGPVIDVVPDILADGHTVNLRTIPSTTDFLGYDKSTAKTNVYTATREKVEVPTVLPRFTVRQSITTANLWDGQTLVLEPHESSLVGGQPTAITASEKDRQLLVFVTVDLVDPAGNKIHSAEDMPFAQTAIPVQPEPKTQ